MKTLCLSLKASIFFSSCNYKCVRGLSHEIQLYNQYGNNVSVHLHVAEEKKKSQSGADFIKFITKLRRTARPTDSAHYKYRIYSCLVLSKFLSRSGFLKQSC